MANSHPCDQSATSSRESTCLNGIATNPRNSYTPQPIGAPSNNLSGKLSPKSEMKKSLILLLGILLLANVGCMQRRLTVRSNPPGALVYVDNVEIGLTPVSIPFTYYGTRTIRLEKDRFKTVEVQQKINAPWYQIPPLDFVSDVLVPFEIRDERQVKIDMQALEPTNETEVLQRANHIRQNSQQGFAVPR